MRWWDVQTGASVARPKSYDGGKIQAYIQSEVDEEKVDQLLSKLQSEREVRVLERSPDNRMLLTQRNVSNEFPPGGWWVLQFWDLTTGDLRVTSDKVRFSTQVFWSPDCATLVLVGFGGTKTRLLDARTGRVKAKLPYEGCVSDRLFGSTGCEPWIFSDDSRLLLMQKGPLKLWAAETGALIVELESARPPAVFSPTNNRLIATLSKDNKKALLWEVAN